MSSEPTDPGLAALKRHYRSGTSSLDRDFFSPCLVRSVRYDRAVGYFTSYALATWADAVPRLLAKSDVGVRLVVGPVLLEEDRRTLEQLTDPDERAAYEQGIADRTLMEVVDRLREGSSLARQELFGRLVVGGQLQIRFAFPVHVPDADVYHEKFGIFTFADGHEVAFSGSANETAGGHRRNFEQVDVYRSWVPGDELRVVDKKVLFADTWSGTAEGLQVRAPSAETLARVRVLVPSGSGGLAVPRDKWGHQADAAAAFLTTPNRRGILEMATGTGKTKTSLLIAQNLFESGQITGLVVTAAGNDLLEQWYKELLAWSASIGRSLYRHFGSHHDIGSFTLVPDNSILVCSRLALPQLARALSPDVKGRLLVIHDEAHGFGSPGMRAQLSGFHDGFVGVLGLTATPEREYDEAGNAFIESEIGPVVYEFDVEQAIRRGILCPFDYLPVEYHLTDEDRRRLQAVFAAKSAAEAAGNPWSDEQLYRSLAMVYKTAAEKPALFADLVARRPDVLKAALVFVETREYALPFLDTVGRRTTSYSTYFDDDPPARLDELSRGVLDCLVCCKRLSEGVDVQHLRNVILVSADRSRLQTVQRIGRTLRTDPKDLDKIATVVDFVLAEAEPHHPDLGRREWLERLSRVRPDPREQQWH